MNKSLKKALGNALLLLASTGLTLATVEFALRLSGTVPWDTAIWAGWRYQGNDPVNELGYRGQAISYRDTDIVIVLLGDSQVESTACSPGLMPEKALERHLRLLEPRYRVFSVGSGGYGNDQEYLALRYYFENFRADGVVLWETFENDVWNNVFPTHFPRDGLIKPTYWLDRGKLQGPNYQLGELVAKPAKTKIGVLLNRWLHPQRGLDEAWESRLPKPYEPLQHFDGKYLRDWDPGDPENKNPFLDMENLRNEKTHFSVELYPRSDRMQYGLDLTRELLGRIADLSREHGSTFAILSVEEPREQKILQQNEQDDIVVHKRDGLFYQTRFRTAMENLAYMNQGFRVFTIPIQREDWKVSDTDSHLNCRAIDEVMETLAGRIAEGFRPGQAPSVRH